MEVFGDGTIKYQNGRLDLKWHYPSPSVSIGSLEGNGEVILWDYGLQGSNLTVGSNDLSTIFGGVIHGEPLLGILTKVGKGTFTLSNANLYGGGTIIKEGSLLARNTSGLATGPGSVQVKHGKLGGTGIIAGAVTVGTGTGRGAFVAPGNRVSLGTLTIQSLLTFNSDAIYDFALNSSRLAADEVIAQGVTINSGALSYVDNGTATLPPGTSFTVISNTSATPINGTFSNLPDGSTITMGNNTYQVSYEGGDGNDLTLTVVP